MSYQALYRVYRPTTFDEVKGQDAVVTTLKNILENDKLVHAYLFSGPHGTGKTSIAKIFANAINCIHKIDSQNPCQICVDKLASNLDITELDAASNNGADDIRRINDDAISMPLNGKYKIFIIDEVHMLSKAAFNAFLKTLEEAPKHSVFILATTEANKIPATILSRVQRLNFRRISNTILKMHLQDILIKEHIEFDEQSLNYIVKLANGSLRDALSIADQASVYGNKNITIQSLISAFGITSYETVIDLLNFASNDLAKAMKMLHDLNNSGANAEYLLNNIIAIIKDFILMSKTNTDEFNSVLTFDQKKQFYFTTKTAYDLLDFAIQTFERLYTSNTPFDLLEILVIRIHNHLGDLNLKTQVFSTTEMEKRLKEIKAEDNQNRFKVIQNVKVDDEISNAPKTSSLDVFGSFVKSVSNSKAGDLADVDIVSTKSIQIDTDDLRGIQTPPEEDSIFDIVGVQDHEVTKPVEFQETQRIKVKEQPKAAPNIAPKSSNFEATSTDLLKQTNDFISSINESNDYMDTQENFISTNEILIDTDLVNNNELISSNFSENVNPFNTLKEEKVSDSAELVDTVILNDPVLKIDETQMATTSIKPQFKSDTLDNTLDFSNTETNSFNKTETKIDLNNLAINLVTKDIYSKSDLINLFKLRHSKDAGEYEKENYRNRRSHFENIRFKDYEYLFGKLKFVTSGENFVILTSDDDNVVFSTLEKIEDPKFYDLIYSIFKENKHVFVATINLVTEAKNDWKINRDKYMSEPKPQPLKENKKKIDPEETLINIFGDDLNKE
ncbi:DNA polymerase III subunit gamma/tau [Mycoplasmopsis agassizii]|uniref:DNA polymerase III subunit gamma/tau n=1 Tax=Mycoplasmopsis agassizii TaxID=33922 RepID=A0ABX4H577_9BACT|nr:DNA polymerase III subunit gamma/tau [Mycoplasmopsis agassizii]PAF55013.1 DNA polymerase III, subunit gamma and tau [Mycoplasmopsis agassizii]SMC17555.1 DNA polymerase-3 subunit gamma/tau [Mycoplasmopsis agassizii]